MENKGRGFHIFVAGVWFDQISLFSAIFWIETDFTAGIELTKGRLRFDRGVPGGYATTLHILIFQGYPVSSFFPSVNINLTEPSASVFAPQNLSNFWSKLKLGRCTVFGRMKYSPYRRQSALAYIALQPAAIGKGEGLPSDKLYTKNNREGREPAAMARCC